MRCSFPAMYELQAICLAVLFYLFLRRCLERGSIHGRAQASLWSGIAASSCSRHRCERTMLGRRPTGFTLARILTRVIFGSYGLFLFVVVGIVVTAPCAGQAASGR